MSLWTLLGSLGSHLEASWTYLEAFLGRLVPLWSVSWGVLERLERLLGRLGRLLERLGLLLDVFGNQLGASWAPCGASWAPLGPPNWLSSVSWTPLGLPKLNFCSLPQGDTAISRSDLNLMILMLSSNWGRGG